jgi:hypothetical protein
MCPTPFVCVCVCVYIYIYIYTYIHTYIHAHTPHTCATGPQHGILPQMNAWSRSCAPLYLNFMTHTLTCMFIYSHTHTHTHIDRATTWNPAADECMISLMCRTLFEFDDIMRKEKFPYFFTHYTLLGMHSWGWFTPVRCMYVCMHVCMYASYGSPYSFSR